MASLTPPVLPPAALTPADRLERLRALFPKFCANQSGNSLFELLRCLENGPTKNEVRAAYNRICAKNYDSLPHAALAICLFCLFETIRGGAQAVPGLLDHLRRIFVGLEARFGYLPRHCMSNNALYNHLYGLWATCIISDEAVTLDDLVLVLRWAEGDNPVLRAFEEWRKESRWVKEYGQHSAFHDAVRDAVVMFLFKAPQSQPHVLLQVMLAVEKLGAHIDVADYVGKFGVQVDIDPKNIPLVNQTAPIPVPNQQAAAGQNQGAQGQQPAQVPAQSAQLPSTMPAPTFSQQPQQVHSQQQSPRSTRNFSAANIQQQLQQGRSLSAVFGSLGQSQQALNNRVDALRRSSAPQSGSSSSTNSANAFGSGSNAQLQQGPFGQQLQQPPAGYQQQQGFQQPPAVYQPMVQPPFQQQPPLQQPTMTQPNQSMTSSPATAPNRPPPRKQPVVSSPSTTQQTSTPPSTRRRSTRAIKHERVSDDDEEDEDWRMDIPDDDPNDEDFVE